MKFAPLPFDMLPVPKDWPIILAHKGIIAKQLAYNHLYHRNRVFSWWHAKNNPYPIDHVGLYQGTEMISVISADLVTILSISIIKILAIHHIYCSHVKKN